MGPGFGSKLELWALDQNYVGLRVCQVFIQNLGVTWTGFLTMYTFSFNKLCIFYFKIYNNNDNWDKFTSDFMVSCEWEAFMNYFVSFKAQSTSHICHEWGVLDQRAGPIKSRLQERPIGSLCDGLPSDEKNQCWQYWHGIEMWVIFCLIQVCPMQVRPIKFA